MKALTLKTNILVLALFAFVLPNISFAQVPRLEVTFTPNPLFSEIGVMPGDSVSGTVLVENNSGESQTVITEAINVSDPNFFSDTMNLSITDDDSNVLFDSSNGTFFDFLTNGRVTLTNTLPDGDSITYTFTVEFFEETGNEYQNKEFGFDLCVGFEDILSGMNCGDTVISGDGNTGGGIDTGGDGGTTTPGSGGGGHPVDLVHLQIFNEGIADIDDVGGSAVVIWDTNLFSTSQVVYGLTSGGPYSLNPNVPNFGYPMATIEDPYKVIEHVVILTGLVPGEEYSYRVVSRASPATISYEHKFVVEEKSTEEGDIILAIVESLPTQTTGSGSLNRAIAQITSPTEISEEQDSGPATSTATTTEETIIEDEPIVPSTSAEDDGLNTAQPGLLAAAFFSGFFDGEASCITYIAITLLLLYLVDVLYSRFVNRRMNKSARTILWLVSSFIALVTWLLLSKLCVVLTLLPLIVFLLARAYMLKEKKKQKQMNILHKKPLV